MNDVDAQQAETELKRLAGQCRLVERGDTQVDVVLHRCVAVVIELGIDRCIGGHGHLAAADCGATVGITHLDASAGVAHAH